MSGKAKRLILIGLDGMPSEFVLKFKDDLPNMSKLMSRVSLQRYYRPLQLILPLIGQLLQLGHGREPTEL